VAGLRGARIALLPAVAAALTIAPPAAADAAIAAAAPGSRPVALFAALLADMHPEHSLFVRQVRAGQRRLHPQGALAGVVRPGGSDPLDPADAPRAGQGERNDIVVYDDTFEVGASEAWQRLIVDHEYFHTRHLAHGAEPPAVDFGDAEASRHYYEALAWQHNLERIEASRYPGLSIADARRARQRYREHRAAFERWLKRDHPHAWRHYGKFFDAAGEAPGEGVPSAAEEGAAPGGR
jgi:hypothetical protein